MGSGVVSGQVISTFLERPDTVDARLLTLLMCGELGI